MLLPNYKLTLAHLRTLQIFVHVLTVRTYTVVLVTEATDIHHAK